MHNGGVKFDTAFSLGRKMDTTRLTVVLTSTEYRALFQVANKELRGPADQARFILRTELVRRGFLVDQNLACEEESRDTNYGTSTR
jgi:hypothetical protein